MQSTDYYAHSADGESSPSANWQPLREHLEGVAKLAKSFAIATGVPGLPEAAEAAGWLHDLGKYQLEWQKYLLASAAKLFPKMVPHSIYGAAYAFTQLQHCPLTLAIAGHHTGLPDWIGGEEFDGLVQSKAPQTILSALKIAAKLDGTEFLDTIAVPECEDTDAGLRKLEYWTRVLFSTLIDADRLNSAGLGQSDLKLDPGVLLEKMKASPPKPSDKSSEKLNELRNRVFAACVAAGQSDRGFFELTVPTGGGKTRSGMAFALAHAKQHTLRRVFVVIPYLSIIEQNAEQYRELFGKDVVLEHHSAVVPDDKSRGRGESYERHLPTENWDVPIVVTTSVQFLETLLAASTRRCRRLHNVTKSVIVFDEAQCLPSHILNPLLDVFRELVSNYGCSIVFSTATQPAFNYSPQGLTHGLKPKELKPILPNELRKELYHDLQRVTFRNETATPWDWKELVKRLLKVPALCVLNTATFSSPSDCAALLEVSALCVLNTRRHAREVWDLLKIEVIKKARDEGKTETEIKDAIAGVRHLSSSLCAQHRMDILGKKEDRDNGSIYARLNAKLPCWVVSTQVIEAGVDIDFPRVFRALGPLDSIVQAGGRCNREGTLKDNAGQLIRGEVFVFRPADESMPPGQYQMASGEAMTKLGEISPDELVTNPEVFGMYFNTIYGRVATDAADIQQMRADWKFDSVAKEAKVIDDGGRAVIVPYRKAQKWIQQLRRKGTYDLSTMRRLQRYTVNLRKNDFDSASAVGLVKPLFADKPDGPWVLEDGCYDDNLGVVIAGITPEQEIQ